VRRRDRDSGLRSWRAARSVCWRRCISVKEPPSAPLSEASLMLSLLPTLSYQAHPARSEAI
jgi:hypothetical protein